MSPELKTVLLVAAASVAVRLAIANYPMLKPYF